MIILCDMDSVVVNLLGPWLERYNAKYGRSMSICDITDWNMDRCAPDGAEIFSILNEPGFFRQLPIMPGAQQSLEALSKRHEIYLVSSGSAATLSDKAHWVAEHLPFMKGRAFFTEGKTPKGLIMGDALLDDGPHNLIDFKKRNPSKLAIAAHYPYTTPATSIVDAVFPFHTDSERGWQQVVDFFLHEAEWKLEKRR